MPSRPPRCRPGAALLARWPHAILAASEDAVGLPAGQMGNSEVGPPQPRRRPARPPGPAAHRRRDRGWLASSTRPALLDACRACGSRRRTPPPRQPHRPGRRPRQRPAPRRPRRAGRRAGRPGGPRPRPARRPRHAAAVRARLRRGPRARASPPPIPDARIAIVGGRYFAMDRDQPLGPGRARLRRDRPRGRGAGRDAPPRAIEAAYARGENDEFVAPTVIDGVDGIGPRRRPGHPRQLPGRSGPPADPRPGRRRSSTASTAPRRTAGRPRRTCSSSR